MGQGEGFDGGFDEQHFGPEGPLGLDDPNNLENEERGDKGFQVFLSERNEIHFVLSRAHENN